MTYTAVYLVGHVFSRPCLAVQIKCRQWLFKITACCGIMSIPWRTMYLALVSFSTSSAKNYVKYQYFDDLINIHFIKYSLILSLIQMRFCIYEKIFHHFGVYNFLFPYKLNFISLFLPVYINIMGLRGCLHETGSEIYPKWNFNPH